MHVHNKRCTSKCSPPAKPRIYKAGLYVNHGRIDPALVEERRGNVDYMIFKCSLKALFFNLNEVSAFLRNQFQLLKRLLQGSEQTNKK